VLIVNAIKFLLSSNIKFYCILLQAIKRCDFASDEEQNLICSVNKVNFDSYSSAAKWLSLW